MTRKEGVKYLKHRGLLLLTAIPLILILDLFCFKNLQSGLVIFLNVVIGLVWIIVLEIIITKVKKSKQSKKEKFNNGK